MYIWPKYLDVFYVTSNTKKTEKIYKGDWYKYMWYEYKNGEKVTRFSIRKYHFGAASVAVASLIIFICGK